MATVGQTAFAGVNPNPGQFAAIQNGANSNSLVNQLFGASNVFKAPTNTSTPQTITQSPNVQAASSAVKSPSAPSNASVASLLMGPLATAPTAQTTSQAGSGSVPYTPPQTTSPVINTPSATNPTSNPNANYTAGAAQTVNTPAAVQQLSNAGISTAPTGATVASTPATQASLIQQEEDLINKQNSQQEGLTSQEQTLENNFANMNAGILSQPGEIGYQTGRQAQLQNTEQQGLAQLEQSQADLAAYEQPQLAALGTAANQLGPQSQEITAPAGAVTTLANSGQQFSNPIYEPASGAYQALSPQPNGTLGQPSTAGQASQYAVKQGDSLTSIAAANGLTTAQLEAANPQIANVNLIKPGDNITIPASGTGNTAFSGGIAVGQAALGQQQAVNQAALAQARGIQQNITNLLQQNPTLNASPAALGNAITQWANSTAVPSGPYVNLLNDLQEYANTIAPVLGVGGSVTDNKTAIATQMVPVLASGGTIQQALANLDANAVTKINAVPAAAQNASIPAQSQGGNSTRGTITAGGYTFVQNAQGQWVAQ